MNLFIGETIEDYSLDLKNKKVLDAKGKDISSLISLEVYLNKDIKKYYLSISYNDQNINILDNLARRLAKLDFIVYLENLETRDLIEYYIVDDNIIKEEKRVIK